MKTKTLHIILSLWCSLLWASPSNSSIEVSSTFSNEVVSLSKDSLNPKEKDSTKTKKVDKAHLAHLQQMAKLRQQSGLTNAIGFSSENTEEIEEVEKTFRSFPSLDQKILDNKDFNVSFANRRPEFTPEFITANFDGNPPLARASRSCRPE